MILSCVEFFAGYVMVAVSGGSPERFMNLCATKNRDLWDFQPTEDGIVVKVRASEYRNLKSAARSAGCHLHIRAKKGLPFLVKKYRHRYGIVVGMILFILLLNLLCGRIWTIQIQGIEEPLMAEFEKILLDYSIGEGMSAKGQDWSTLRQRVLADNPEYAWMSFNPQGTTLYVDVSKAAKVPEKVDNSVPSNLYAAVDGRIVAMQIERGKPMVQVGDAVVKGDLLVSGITEYADGCAVFRQAGGKVLAETTRTLQAEIPYTQTHPMKTGEIKKRYVLTAFGVSIPLFLGSVSDPCEKIVTTNRAVIGGKQLPFSFTTAEYHILKDHTVVLTKDEAVAEGVEQIQEDIRNQLSHAEVLSIAYDTVEAEDSVVVKGEVFCKENISLEEKLLIF